MGTEIDKKKQDINMEYGAVCGELGQQLYRVMLPYLEMLEKMKRMMGLNQRMAAVMKEEADEANKVPKLEPIQPA